MSDWKKKIDNNELAKLMAHRKQEEQLAKQREIENESPELKAFREIFFCHVCITPSKGPMIHTGKFHSTSFDRDSDEVYRDPDTVDWSYPIDLLKCSICEEWTCNEHIHNRICKSCAEKLP